ncbi:MAG: hypothetical protein AB9903_31430 [Vulcanimicrobiota bacterium]
MKQNLRFYGGIAILAIAWLLPLLGIPVSRTNWPIAVKAAIIGLLTFGGPELLSIVAIIVLGRESYELILQKLKKLFKRLKPSGKVSRLRYHIGLAMFLLPIVPSYIMAYAPHLLPDTSPQRLIVSISSDLMFIISLFVLGGDFWDKLRSLFIYDSHAVFQEKQE